MAKSKIRTTREQRLAGRVLRDKCLRASHGGVILGQGGERDIVAMIEQSNQDRLPNLVPIRHGRMLQNAFAFLRGAAAIHAYDLAGTPASGINVQACGDCHLMNFGGFATLDRGIVFDVNDFDETYPAPFEWDLKRLATSFVVAARFRRFKPATAREIAVEAVAAYRRTMWEHRDQTVLDAWYGRMDPKDLAVVKREAAALDDRVKRTGRKRRLQTDERLFHKLTAPGRGGLPRIADEPPLIYHTPEIAKYVADGLFQAYRATLAGERLRLFDRFTYVDTAIKVVGTGSVGTRCMVSLFLGAPDDPLFLQVKEAHRSVLEQYGGLPAAAARNGERVVEGQRLMQAGSDVFLGWATGDSGRDFYVREAPDMKLAPVVETQTRQAMRRHATFCGMAIARAHARVGGAASIAGYLGRSGQFDQAVGDYAVGYADQVERDYDTFREAVRSGRLKTDLGDKALAALLK